MAGYYLTDAEFIKEWKILSSPIKFASKHGMDVRSVHNRRRTSALSTIGADPLRQGTR